MNLKKVSIAPFEDVIVITPQCFEDHRGNFVESYNRKDYENIGITNEFVQDNQSLSFKKGTIRGLHFQKAPYAQAKLVRALTGSAYDVVVDVRKKSPTFGKWAGVVLDAKTHQQIYIPEGFAHGFCALEDQTIMNYKVSAFYSKDHDRGIFWNDPALAIDWPLNKEDAILSDKDKSLPPLQEYSDSL
ncbi:MAG: dTDP-4-dehydrorhamnose 3,5-epimerase [Pseudobdellovibrionaceae bacterium]|jgi:dTDP-4-dehydrorhamnose 3,5-epimerase|nr:dTDP-4-dehydrorhamnose 3,5-epimerase [Pseudobdellovibrionaceae bacterium]